MKGSKEEREERKSCIRQRIGNIKEEGEKMYEYKEEKDNKWERKTYQRREEMEERDS